MTNEQTPLRRIGESLLGSLTPEEEEQILQRHPERRAIWDELDRQDAIVVQALKEQAHLDVDSVAVLVNTRESYPEAIPVLLRFLCSEGFDLIKESIVRALTVKEARGIAARPLIEEFKRIDVPPKQPRFEGERDRYGLLIRELTPEERRLSSLWHLKWAIGNALSVVADESVTDEIVDLLSDKAHGGTRSALVEALLRLKPTNREELLLNLLQDEDDSVAISAAGVCGRLRIQEARELIQRRFTTHHDSWYRQKAKSALSKLDKVKSGG